MDMEVLSEFYIGSSYSTFTSNLSLLKVKQSKVKMKISSILTT